MPSTLSLYIGLLVLLVSPLALLLMVLLVGLFVLLALLVHLVVHLALVIMINHLATILETLLPSCLLCIEQLLFPNIFIFHTISTILVFQHLLSQLSMQATTLSLSLHLLCWSD